MFEQFEKIIRQRFDSVPHVAALAMADCHSTAEFEAVLDLDTHEGRSDGAPVEDLDRKGDRRPGAVVGADDLVVVRRRGPAAEGSGLGMRGGGRCDESEKDADEKAEQRTR